MQAKAVVLDVMKVPAAGDPTRAVVWVDANALVETVECDVLVVGGGMGGVAGAWAAARRGHRVCLLEETDWLGGQMTAQGISALDEHAHIERFGGTRSYYAMREAIRDHYRALAVPGVSEPLNPGSCWVTALAFEPRVGLTVLERLLAPEIGAGRLSVFLRTKACAAEMEGDRVTGVRTVDLDSRRLRDFRFRYVLDATELGDLLPLTGTEYAVGAESVAETGEPHAQPEEPKAHCVQSLTYVFAMERRPAGEHHTIERPARYAHYRDTQPFSLRIHVHGGEIYGEETGWLDYQVFEETPGTKGPLWRYRRLVDAAQFPAVANDITMFNWPGLDYRDLPVVDQDPMTLAHALQDAKRVGLGFAHWLQTEAPNPAGSPGLPDLKLRPDVMGSADGLAKYPYIRECRRIRARKTIVEQEVAVAHQPSPRAAHFVDSVGIGWYPIDIHQAGEDDVGTSTRTKPFQIPLGALIPARVENLIAANKNLGTTHITNGCYRLHPVEWNTGEAAGVLAARALETVCTPAAIHADAARRSDYQHVLLAEGVPICWLIDVPPSRAEFAAVQRFFMVAGGAGDRDDLDFRPDEPISPEDRARWISRIAGSGIPDPCGAAVVPRAAFAQALVDACVV